MTNLPPEPDFTDCPHWGKGGRYVVDQATGRRVPAVADVADGEAPTPTEVLNETPTKKGKHHHG